MFTFVIMNTHEYLTTTQGFIDLLGSISLLILIGYILKKIIGNIFN